MRPGTRVWLNASSTGVGISKLFNIFQTKKKIGNLDFTEHKLSWQHWTLYQTVLTNYNILSIICQGDSPFGKQEAYVKLEPLGEGSYATVYKGFSKWV